MEEETFALVQCSCSQAFVRAYSEIWTCPACNSGDCYEIQNTPGPARDKVGVAEFRKLTAD